MAPLVTNAPVLVSTYAASFVYNGSETMNLDVTFHFLSHVSRPLRRYEPMAMSGNE